MSNNYESKSKAELISEITSLKRSLTRKRNELQREKSLKSPGISNCVDDLFDQSPLATFIISANGNIEYTNPQFTTLFGYTSEDVPDAKTWFKLAYPDSKYRTKLLNAWRKDVEEAGQNPIPSRTFKVRAKDNTVKQIKFNVIFDESGQQVVFMEDITKLSGYESLLKESDKKMREIFNNTDDSIYLWSFENNKAGNCLEVNEKACKLLEYSKKEFSQLTPFDILAKKYHKNLTEFLSTLSKKRKGFLEGEHVSKSGKRIPVEISVRTFRQNGRKVLLSISRDVSERKKIQSKILESERKFRTLIDESPFSIEIYDDKGMMVHTNHSWEELWLRDKEAYINKYNILKDPISKKLGLLPRLKEAYSGIKGIVDLTMVDLPDLLPVKKVLRTNFYPIFNDDEKVSHVVVVNEDFTDLANTENELMSSEEKFRSIVENSLSGIMIIDNKFKITYANKQLSQITKYSLDELSGMDFRILLDREYKQLVSDRYQERQRGKNIPNQYELQIVRKDGALRWLELTSTIIKTRDGIPSTIAQVIDITDTKNSMAAISASEERFRMIMEQSPVSMQIFNVDGSLLRVNKAWYDLWDMKESEAIIEGYDLLNDKQAASNGLKDAFLKACNGHSIDIPEMHYIPANSNLPGRERLLHCKIYPLKDERKKVKFVVMINEDITDRKKTEVALIASEEKYRSLYENANVGIFSSTLDCEFLLANPAMVKMLGFDSFEDLKMFNNELKCFIDEEHMKLIRKTLLAKGEIHGMETKLKMKSGKKIVVLLNAKAINNKRRQIEYFEGIVEDISERIEAEKAIIAAKEEAEKSDRLKSEFLAQVSHEIRTPVNTILSFSGLISEELDDIMPEDLRPSFGIMSNAGRRIIRTIDLILNMSEVQTGTYEPLMKEIHLFDDVLYDLYLEYLSAAKEKELSLIIHNHVNSSLVIGDEYTVSQIFNNLINNAIKYTHRGRVEINLGRDSEKQLFIEISDTGIGIAKNYMPNIFEPFSQEDQGYTRRFEGNGLGLALVKKYCELNHAQIFVESVKGKGSTFRIVFEKIEILRKKLQQE
ncbi:MAG: PAS domain S-box protein [Bacteroidetes bacterium]|nr:PAS domain S-box protein [Bacteroidota bacterium]